MKSIQKYIPHFLIAVVFIVGPFVSFAIPGKFVVGGPVNHSTTWSGDVFVNSSISVPEGVTLTLNPGTTLFMKQSRDYKNPDKLAIEVHGTLVAVGTNDKPIRFTSDDPQPQNGDWSMIRLFGKTGSEITYAIIEFGQQGINMWQSDAHISHSIVRWNNWEGIYAESYSTPVIEYNHVYQNGYNGLAVEQFNTVIVRNNIFEKSGTHGVHVDASTATLENNILRDNGAAGLSVDDAAHVTARNNTMSGNKITPVMCGEGNNTVEAAGNKFIPSEGAPPTQCPESVFTKKEPGQGAADITFDIQDATNYDLGYTPGDRQKDRYLYVYPDDETRRVVGKIGKGLGLTWSLDVVGTTVWTSTLSGDVYNLDADSGELLKHFKAPSAQPWGMAFDGKRLWITDFAEKRTYALDPESGKELTSFKNPDQEHGAKGLAWDGKYLNIMGWTTSIIYKITETGKVVKKIKINEGVGGGLTWDGKNFWVPCGGRICKISPKGKVVGRIYVASEGTWDLAWQPAKNKYGGFLWASQRTNENWYDDEKIFKVEILNDQKVK